MEYPLLIAGQKKGAVNVERDGLYTIFEAWTEENAELMRVWVYGGGKQGYLGVLQPWSGGMYLKRRMSRSELREFPENIEYASNQDEHTGEDTEITPERQEKIIRREYRPEPVKAPEQAPEQNRSEPQAAGESGSAAETAHITPPETANSDSESLLWFKRPDGSLTAFDGRGSLIALPAELREETEGTVMRYINGKEYMIFRY